MKNEVKLYGTWIMTLLLIILAVILFFSSCKPRQKVVKEQSIITIESKDTVIKTVPDLASLSLFLRCDSSNHVQVSKDSVTKQGQHVKILYDLKLDTLYIQAPVDSFSIYFKYKNTHEQKIVVTTPKQMLNWWKIVCIAIGICYFLTLLIMLLILLKNN